MWLCVIGELLIRLRDEVHLALCCGVGPYLELDCASPIGVRLHGFSPRVAQFAEAERLLRSDRAKDLVRRTYGLETPVPPATEST